MANTPFSYDGAESFAHEQMHPSSVEILSLGFHIAYQVPKNNPVA